MDMYVPKLIQIRKDGLCLNQTMSIEIVLFYAISANWTRRYTPHVSKSVRLNSEIRQTSSALPKAKEVK